MLNDAGNNAGGLSRLVDYIERKNKTKKIINIAQDVTAAYSSGQLNPNNPQQSAQVLQQIAEKNRASIPEMSFVMEKFAGIIKKTKDLDIPTEREKFTFDQTKAARDLMAKSNIPLANKEVATTLSELSGVAPRIEWGATGQALQAEGGPTRDAGILANLLRDQGISDVDRYYTGGPPSAPSLPTSEVGLFAQRGAGPLEEFLKIRKKYPAKQEVPHYEKFNNKLMAIYPDGTKRVIEEGSLEERAFNKAMHDPNWAFLDEMGQYELIQKYKRFLEGRPESIADTERQNALDAIARGVPREKVRALYKKRTGKEPDF